MRVGLVVVIGSWLLAVLSLPVARLLRAIDGRAMVVMGAVLVAEALHGIEMARGGEPVVSVLLCIFCLNVLLLFILAIRFYQRGATSYLWGAMLSWWRTAAIHRSDSSLLQLLFSPLVQCLWIHEVRGIEHIPTDGPCLLAFNHESYFDFICFAAVAPRRVHYLAAEKFFDHPLWKWVMRDMGCIRIDRRAGINRTGLRRIREVISEGRLVGIFPEGTRSPDGRLLRAKPGVASLALHTGLPVVPVGLVGTYEIMSRHDLRPKLRKASINIGAPVHLDMPEQGKPDSDFIQQSADKIMLQIAALTGKEYPYGEYSRD